MSNASSKAIVKPKSSSLMIFRAVTSLMIGGTYSYTALLSFEIDFEHEYINIYSTPSPNY